MFPGKDSTLQATVTCPVIICGSVGQDKFVFCTAMNPFEVHIFLFLAICRVLFAALF